VAEIRRCRRYGRTEIPTLPRRLPSHHRSNTVQRGNDMNFDKELDTRGLSCPLPILRAKKALAEMTAGQVLRIQATDPGSVKDFAAFAKQTGNELLSSAEKGTEFEFFLKCK
jgi:tRNA 2-thiouridine synthesizing protein A